MSHPQYQTVTLLSLVLLLLSGTAAIAQTNPVEDHAFLWRGFTHEWDTRNHRIDRLGSWMSMNCDDTGCDGDANHSASTGTAVDDADFVTAFTELSTPVAGMKTGLIQYSISGIDGQLSSGTRHVTVTAPANMQNRDRYRAFLNGFHLERLSGESKKLDRLKILLTNLNYVNGSLEFDIEWALKMDCRFLVSPECIGSNVWDYRLQVRFFLMAGDVGEVAFSNSNPQHDYVWDGGPFATQVTRGDVQMSDVIASTAVATFNHGTVGIRGFNLNLDTDHHMYETAVRVKSIVYDAVQSSVSYNADAFFAQWQEEMAGPFDPFTFQVAGEATQMELWTSLIQLSDAEINGNWAAGSVNSEDDPEAIPVSF